MQLKLSDRYNQLRVAFNLLNECNGNIILDIGCGDGLLEQYFTDRKIIGLDISLAALYKAKKKAPWSNYIQANLRSLPIKDGCIDTVAMIAVLGGVSQCEEAIAFSEAKRVLKDGGYLVILVSQKCLPYSLLAPDRLFGGWRWRHFDVQFLQRMLMENGFNITKTIFAGGILSLSMSLLNSFWGIFWRFFSRRIMGKVFVPPLPYRFLNKIEGLEFYPFRGKLQAFARFFYLVAQKI